MSAYASEHVIDFICTCEHKKILLFFRAELDFSTTILWQWANSRGKLYSHRTYEVWNMDKLVRIK